MNIDAHYLCTVYTVCIIICIVSASVLLQCSACAKYYNLYKIDFMKHDSSNICTQI